MNVSSGQQIEVGKTRVIAESEIPLLRTTVAGLADKRAATDADTAEQPSTAMLHDSLDALVRLLERVRPGMRGSILLLESDGVTLRHGAAPRLPADYCAAIDGAHIGPKAGSCGTAAYRRERVIVRDIATDPLWADYRTLAEPYGLVACWSTPIFDSDGTVLGTFAMYPDKPVEPTADDLSLTEMATLLARNIIKRARAATELGERTEAAERLAVALSESEARFRAVAESIPVQVWTATPDGLLDFVTNRTANFFDRPASALLGTGWLDVVHPDDTGRATKRWMSSLQTGEPYEVEVRALAADGKYRWHLVRADAMRSPDQRITQRLGFTVDIDDHKRLEAARDAALADARNANKAKADFL